MTGEAFVEMFSFFFTMGFKNSMLQYAAQSSKDHGNNYEEGLRRALGNAIIIRLIIAVPICLLIYLSSIYLNHEPLMVKVVIAYAFVELFKSFTNIFGIIRKALNQFKLVAGINVFDKALKLAIIIIVFKYIGGLEELLYAYVIVGFIKFFISFVTTIKLCKPKFELHNFFPMVKESFLYGIFDYLEEAQSKVDRLMINSLLGPSAVAFYSIPSKLNRLIKVVPVSIKQVFLPQMHKFSSSTKDTDNLLKKLSILIIGVSVPLALGIFFFSETVLDLCFDDKYQPAIELAPMFAFIAVIWFLNTAPNMLLAAQGDHKGRNFIQLAAVIANVALNFIFIPQFGIVGAIWATITANFLKFISLTSRYIIKFRYGQKDPNSHRLSQDSDDMATEELT